MPVLLRFIAQRVFLIGLSLLTFVGVNPELDTLTTEQAQEATEERKDLIVETLATIATEAQEATEPLQSIIPLPRINVLDVPINIPTTQNITPPTATASTPPVLPHMPVQTSAPSPQPPRPTPSTTEPPSTATPKPPVTPTPTAVAPVAAEQKVTLDTSTASTIANTVVSIVCVRYNGNKIHLTNGSGVLVSSKGVVLTNSHVAQMFLLKDKGYDCSIRRENIPTYGFTAIPLYINEDWVEDNFLAISSPSPVGTGENDYALLLITANTNPALSLPRSFPAADLNTASEAAEIGDDVTVAGYPGIQTNDFNIATQASLKTDTTTIKNVFTLDRITVDVFATRDTPVAKRGSSGGGVFEDNKLIGTIVTTSPGTSPTSLVINALTLDYINRDIKDATGKTLKEILGGDLTAQAASFGSSVAPRLTELLLRNL